VLTTESELGSLIGYEETELTKAMTSLSERNIIRLRFSNGESGSCQSMSVGFQFEMEKWHLDFDQNVTSEDAIVFPFRRAGAQKFAIVEGQGKSSKKEVSAAKKTTHSRVLDAFCQGRSLDDEELEQAGIAAKILVETHPVDQTLLFLKHFGLRVPSLSLLASSWQHYQEVFEQETQKVDMLEARQKHHELDEKLRRHAQEWIDSAEKRELNSEDTGVLQILLKHSHPRRQLFWAYQLRSRYPALADFFKENAPIMIPITTTGVLVKKT
jgi:hypothetical protein